ncbi:integrase, catalytic region, zinc finger, CCHC-type containing protein [Tanacetum coccineum]
MLADHSLGAIPRKIGSRQLKGILYGRTGTQSVFLSLILSDSDLEVAFQEASLLRSEIRCLQEQIMVMASPFKPLKLRSKDETPEVVIKFLKQIQVGLNKTIRYICTDNGIEFVNKDLTAYYERVGIFQQKTVPRTPQQNGVVERQNRTLVEAARTMLIFSKALMFLWAEAVATALVMSADSAVTYTSFHSEARSWSIPYEDPYEEAARQLLEQAPRSLEYVPNPMELEEI